MSLFRLAAFASVIALVAVPAAARAASARAAPVAYTLSPAMDYGALTALKVEVRFRADPDGVTEFRWLKSWAGSDELWATVRDLDVQGAQGVEAQGHGVWRIRSRPGAPLVVRYRVVSAFDHDPTSGDPNAQPRPIVRPQWFYATGETLFGAPDGDDSAPATFAWTGAPAGWTFASDLQHLSTPARTGVRPGTVADVLESIALGGTDVRVTGSLAGPDRVRVAQRGSYDFSAAQFDRLARRIIATERAFWGDGPSAPFLVTLAPLQSHPPNRSISGTGRTDAFAVWWDRHETLDLAKWLLAHEYFHTWNSRQLGGFRDGDDEALGYWFSEGFTDYYARRLALASGEWTLQDFAASWNEALKAYDLSDARDIPNAAIPKGFWSDPAVKQTPYWRGSLIAAAVDAKLRSAVPGGTGLDGVLRAQRARAAAEPKRPDSDASVVFRETLRASRPDLDAWVERVAERGEPIVLDAAAFAPCFTLSTRPAPTFDRGFDLGATMRNGRKVVGVRPGGPADRAGLRDGDLISIDESTDSDPSVVRRYVVHEPGGGTHEVRYLPVGPERPLQQLSVAPGLDPAATAACVRLFGARDRARGT